MIRKDFLAAFTALGARLRASTEIVIAGGAALMLLGIIDRETGDSDAIESRPKLSTFAADIAAVAEELDLPPGWLNDGVSAHRDVLPTDYQLRLTDIGTFGALRVRALGRVDLILMKLAAGRPRDLEDLRALRPTAADLTFVEAQLDRLNRVFPADALRIQLYLEQKARS